jgi:hypothetical protein
MGLFDEVLDNVGEPYSGGGKGFEYGTHEVLIGTVEAKSKDTKKATDCAIIEVVVFDEKDEDRTATCTLWFHTEGAAKMSVTKVLGMIVHNVGEEKKDAVRELGKKLFGSIDDPIKARDIAAKLMGDKLLTKKAFLVAEPQGKYKTTSYGDLWHYAAEPQTKPVEVAVALDGEDITDTEEADNIPDFDDKKLEDL